MKNYAYLIATLLCSCFILTACSDNTAIESEQIYALRKSSPQNIETTNEVVLHGEKEEQTIDGFGIAQAGWSHYLYAHKKREQVLDLLYGDKGLRLNIFRGEVFPSYSTTPNVFDFGIHNNIELSLDDPFFDIDYNNNENPEYKKKACRDGQLWIINQLQQKYANVDKFIFSTWSAPAYMKSNNSSSKGYLKKTHYQDYANYLSAFCKAYKSIGIPIYGISPANEPEYAAAWDSSIWLPATTTLGRFVTQNLGPTLQGEHPEVKIIIGENAQWTGILGFIMGSKKYVQDILRFNKEITNYPLIAAGHGYIDPVTKKYPNIEPFDKAIDKNIPVWLTEISDPMTSYDPTMVDGLRWAKVFHQFLTEANTNAIIWWAGALPDKWTTEGLIYIDKNRVDYEITKRFEVLGNFSRYIPVGSKRISADYNYKNGYMISAYKTTNKLIVVAINTNDKEISLNTKINQIEISKIGEAYLTDAEHTWSKSLIEPEDNNLITLTLAPSSVTTYVLNLK